MSNLQPYIPKIDAWVSYYANANKKAQVGSVGGGLGLNSGEEASRVESKPQATMTMPTSGPVPPLISPMQEVISQSAANVKRARHKHKATSRGKTPKTAKVPTRRKQKTRPQKRSTTTTKTGKHKKQKRSTTTTTKKGKQQKQKGSGSKKTTKKGTKHSNKKKPSPKSKKTKRRKKAVVERELYPTII